MKIVLAADKNFAMPLAVTIRSVIESNRKHWPLNFYVLNDGSFDANTKDKVAMSIPPGSGYAHFITIDADRFDSLPKGNQPQLNRMTYSRLVIDRVFGEDCRVLYLDCDVLVLDDIAPLFTIDLDGAPVGACDDLHLETALKLRAFDTDISREARKIHPECPGLPDVERYFNAGVMAIDLGAWRKHNISDKAFAYLFEHPKTPIVDQDALNVALEENWKVLSPKWNFQNAYAKGIQGSIVHFVTRHKPWIPASRHRAASFYDAIRERTRFKRGPIDKVLDPAKAFLAGIENVLRRWKTRAPAKPLQEETAR